MPDDSEGSHVVSPRPARRREHFSRTSVRTLSVVVAVLLGGLALGVAVGNANPTDHPQASCGPTTSKLTVQGMGQATATPDLLTVVVQVDAAGPSAAEALASDNAKADGAIAAFKNGGVETKDIQTSGLSQI